MTAISRGVALSLGTSSTVLYDAAVGLLPVALGADELVDLLVEHSVDGLLHCCSDELPQITPRRLMAD